MTSFVMSRLDCHLPWIPTESGNQKRACSRPEDLDNYIDVNGIRQGKLKQALKDFGCLRDNCIRNTFRVMGRDSYSGTFSNETGSLILDITPDDCIQITRQILIYGFSNFVADFGGYLGLLLGASLLSVYDTGLDLLKLLLKSKKPEYCDPPHV